MSLISQIQDNWNSHQAHEWLTDKADTSTSEPTEESDLAWLLSQDAPASMDSSGLLDRLFSKN